jgi:hypothetical protein
MSKTIFRNEPGNVYLTEDVTVGSVSFLIDLARGKGLDIFSSNTENWESIYWLKDEKAIAGCKRVLGVDRKMVSYEEFYDEIMKPKKKV